MISGCTIKSCDQKRTKKWLKILCSSWRHMWSSQLPDYMLNVQEIAVHWVLNHGCIKRKQSTDLHQSAALKHFHQFKCHHATEMTTVSSSNLVYMIRSGNYIKYYKFLGKTREHIPFKANLWKLNQPNKLLSRSQKNDYKRKEPKNHMSGRKRSVTEIPTGYDLCILVLVADTFLPK